MNLNDFLSRVSITEVFEQLGGTVRNNRGVAFWNPEANGESVQLFPNSNTWKYYSQDQGGGVLALIMTARDCNKHQALLWIEQTYSKLGEYRQGRISPEEKRKAELWVIAYRNSLEARKERLSDAFEKCQERNEDPSPMLAADLRKVTTLLDNTARLRQPRQVIEAYRAHVAAKPAVAQKLVGDQMRWEKAIGMAVGV